MKMKEAMRMKPFYLATFAMAMAATHLTAQVFTTLHTFTGGSDGANSYGGLVLAGNTLYGTAFLGGAYSDGTVFKINTDGSGFKVVAPFNGVNNQAYPETGLLLLGGTLYGTSGGPGYTSGTLFAVNTNGTGFMTVHVFTTISAPDYTNSDGAFVWGPLVSSGNTLYGTAAAGGSTGSGTVFAVNTNGSGFTNLYVFTAHPGFLDPFGTWNPPYTNSDGAYPQQGLILSGNTLYGTAAAGGSSGWGTVFAVNTDGTGFTNLYSFTGGSDGAEPLLGTLVQSGNTLYGTTYKGGSGIGSSGNGTLFAINTNGTGFTTLHIFTATNAPYFTNGDGAVPFGGLILSGNTLYGTSSAGGSSGRGTVFAVNTDGTGFTTLHSFSGAREGAAPYASLVLFGNTLYGTTYSGGYYNDGTVFSLSFRPQLTITPSAANLILTWPTNYAGFDYTGYTLQSTTNLGPSAVWSAVSPAPAVVNGQRAVTNSMTGSQMFFRLSQ